MQSKTTISRRARTAIAGLFAFGFGLVADAKPLFEQADVFVHGQDGVFEYRIPGLVTTNKGTLVAFCDARVKKSGDAPNDIDLVMKRSTDGGRTWGALRTLVDNGAGAAADACGLVDRQTGRIWIFYVHAPEGVGSANAAAGITGATFLFKAITSDDDGLTWSPPRDFTAMLKRPEWSAGSTGVGSGIQLRNGRLILPRYTAVYRGSDRGAATAKSFVCYSDDHGDTWRMSALIESDTGTNECQLVELSDGTLMINLRGLSGERRKVAYSKDGGATWSRAMEDERLIEPRCQGSLLALPGNGDRIVFANPASLKRENLTVRYSPDGGRTWPISQTLQAGPAGYSCLTVLQDGTVGCLFERGEKKYHERISFARFSEDWLRQDSSSVKN